MISFIRPLDLVESLVLQRGRRWDESPYNEVSPIFKEHPVCSGLIALLEVFNANPLLIALHQTSWFICFLQVLSLVSDTLTTEQSKRFDQSMFQLLSADQIAKEIADELLQTESLNLLNAMQMALSSVDVCLALHALLQQLSVGMSTDGAKNLVSTPSSKNQYRLFFSGSLGLGALAESSRQMADIRWLIVSLVYIYYGYI